MLLCARVIIVHIRRGGANWLMARDGAAIKSIFIITVNQLMTVLCFQCYSLVSNVLFRSARGGLVPLRIQYGRWAKDDGRPFAVMRICHGTMVLRVFFFFVIMNPAQLPRCASHYNLIKLM